MAAGIRNLHLAGITLRQLVLETSTEDQCRQWLRRHRLLATRQNCPRCFVPMTEAVYTRSVDGVTWRCRRCRTTVNLRKNSFFERSHLSLTTLVEILYWWCEENPNFRTVKQVGVSKKSIVDWFSFIRDICSRDLLGNPVQIGGNGHVVAIDESVIARRKPGNAHGRPVREQWVFGGVDLTTKAFFIELVPQRDAATLLPVIQRNIVAGTTIWSDEWAAYRALPVAGFPHQTVNHSQLYVDPVTGVHTNDIESRWNACKAKMKSRWGVPRGALASYLDDYMWRSRRSHDVMFRDIVNAIAHYYPV